MPLTLPDKPTERKKPPVAAGGTSASPRVADPLPTPDPTQGRPDRSRRVATTRPSTSTPRRPRPSAAAAGGSPWPVSWWSAPSWEAPSWPSGRQRPGGGAAADGRRCPAPTLGWQRHTNGSVQDVVRRIGDAVAQLEPAAGRRLRVVFDKSGLILTAHHVVARTEDLTVKLADGTELPGRVVGRMPERELLVVAVDTDQELAAAELAAEGTVEVGEPVVAIGSPFGISQTVTAGIVSGLHREIESPIGMLTGLTRLTPPSTRVTRAVPDRRRRQGHRHQLGHRIDVGRQRRRGLRRAGRHRPP